MNIQDILAQIVFNDNGLVPVIAQSADTLEVLMMAWMNKEAVEITLKTKKVHYWSRSRKALWHKGETSGHFQTLKEFYVDCDGDTILITIDQIGPACHTGKKTCFFNKINISALT